MKLQAYRGVSTENPENTIEAVRAAADQGYYSARVDLGVTYDGQFVLLRDNLINRTARLENGAELDREIAITDLTYEQALSYDFGIWFSRKFRGEKIPFLWDVLEFASKSGLKLVIGSDYEEFSANDKERLFSLLKGYSDTVILCCKSPEGLENAAVALPNLAFQYNGELSETILEIASSLPKGKLTIWSTLDKKYDFDIIKEQAKLGITMLSTHEELDMAIAAGADTAETRGQLKPPLNIGVVADMHTHSEHSHDCSVSLSDMRKAQEMRGTAMMAVTNHVDAGFANAKEELESIKKAAEEAAMLNAKNDSRCRLLIGVELGDGIFAPAVLRHAEKLCDYDVIIGSVHCGMADGVLKAYSTLNFSERDDSFIDKFLADYFDNLNKTVDLADFDILAHLTCPLRYILGKHKKNADIKKYSGVITEILKKIIKKGIALELNTSSLSLALGDFVPSRDILEKYRELGGYLITLGSDAHILSEAAANFEKAVSLLKELGFKDIYYYKNRRPYQCKLI